MADVTQNSLDMST